MAHQPSKQPAQWLLVLVLLAFASFPERVYVRVEANNPPLVGGAGYALYFDHRRSDVLGFNWVKPPQGRNITIEVWVKIIDPHLLRMSLPYVS